MVRFSVSASLATLVIALPLVACPAQDEPTTEPLTADEVAPVAETYAAIVAANYKPARSRRKAAASCR